MRIEEHVLGALEENEGQRWDEVHATVHNRVWDAGDRDVIFTERQIRSALQRLREKDLAHCGRFVYNEQIWWRR